LHFALIALIAAASLGLANSTVAQDSFPSRPVRMVVPFPAGGGSDILARALAQAFQKATNQPLVVENRTGGLGMIGAAACRNATPDGYTYCLPASDVMAVNPVVFKKVPYDVERDFVVIGSVATLPLAIVANGAIPVNDLKQLATWSQANKDKANFATWGVGSAAHLVLARFNQALGGSLTNVPYAGAPQMMQAVLSNDASAALLFYGPIAQHLTTGKLKALAILGTERYPGLPNVPTVVEQGFDFTPTLYYGVFAPAGSPAPIVARMSQLIATAAADDEVRKTMHTQGFAPLVESPQAFAARLAKDRAAWAPIARSLNLALD